MDLLAVQGTFKSLLQHDSSKASILQPSAFFTAQLSYLYVTAGKIIDLGAGYSLYVTNPFSPQWLEAMRIVLSVSVSVARNSGATGPH